MKYHQLAALTLFLFLSLFTVPVWSAERNEQPPGRTGAFFQQLLKQFDADGDGKLNDEERAKAKGFAANRQRQRPGQQPLNRGEIMKRFDKDGNGRLSADEQSAARRAMARLRGQPGQGGIPAFNREEFMRRFDKDGDGNLSDEERAAARTAFEQRRRQPAAGRFGRQPAGDSKPDRSRVDKQELLEEYDADGDGKLNGEERAAARKAFQLKVKN